jgi:glucose/arabinose dehydrogenase
VGDDFTLYIAEEHQVVRLRRQDGLFAFGPPEVIVQGIPGGGHVTRTIRIRDGLLYLSVGSSCNVCIEKDEMRAAISRYDLEGKSGEIFARGLRNTVGMEFSPWTEDLWGVNNGRDRLGDDHTGRRLRNRHRSGPC